MTFVRLMNGIGGGIDDGNLSRRRPSEVLNETQAEMLYSTSTAKQTRGTLTHSQRSAEKANGRLLA